MRCPRDEAALAELGAEGRFGHRCGRCDGALFAEKRFMAGVGHGDRHALATAADLESLRNLPEGGCVCPRDGAAMRLLRYHGVELDVCAECRSVWVDAGEQAKIRERVRREQRALALDRGAATDLRNGARDEAFEVGGDAVIDFVCEALGSIFDGL